ncbi:hypothetical protein [Flavobacterium sp. GT3R68]|uniref:hypothetical protein n=1 Tax=Flavobacterium sp. GT3R68 TaxID=2594437 RepID=UPI000F8905A1|nr:hypothetical protein [Flavobacterium sp. GT3R68]RTY90617.1 hypothetical protein EKL32_20570 [Flavobacterium sp. GSN2]TRW89857.1 hypothetical protein FNW07_12495 [Flavobacterium sp. GT3R68]
MYSLNKITTVADCDVLLAWAEKEKSDLTFKQLSVERVTTNYSSISVEIDAILQGVVAEIAAVEMVIGVLPDGPTKEDEIKRKTRLEYKRFLLENRKESYGSVALLEKELDLERINKELDETDVFISGVTVHKSTL